MFASLTERPRGLSFSVSRRGFLTGAAAFALALHPLPAVARNETGPDAEALRVLGLLLAELPLKTAARLAAEITGTPKNALYQAGLALKPAAD